MIFSSLAPISLPADDERRYREHFLHKDVRRLLVTYGVAIFFSLAYVVQDYLFLWGRPSFFWLLADRVGMVVITLGVAASGWRSRNYCWIDRSAAVWGVLMALAYLPIVASRPAAFTHSLLGDIVIVMLFHLAMPDNPRWRFLPSLAFSLVSLGTLVFVKQAQPLPVTIAIFTNFIVVNLICIAVSNNAARYRRLFWVDQCRLDELARQRLEMLEARNRLIATLSHEFRTPLNAVAGGASLLDGYLDRLDPAQRGGVLARIQVGVTRLTEMLDQALFISRSQSDRLSFNRQSLKVGDFLRETASEMRLLYPTCRVDIEERDGLDRRDQPRPIEASLLRLVISNLVSNACKFSSPDSEQTLRLSSTAQDLTITVSDHGIGIPQRDQASVFSPFVRATNVGTIQGTGMGLAIVRETVERLGGAVGLDSVPARGTTVTVRLPWPEDVDG